MISDDNIPTYILEKDIPVENFSRSNCNDLPYISFRKLHLINFVYLCTC
jgi:hypothetical protein